jgi:hypothetical protein
MHYLITQVSMCVHATTSEGIVSDDLGAHIHLAAVGLDCNCFNGALKSSCAADRIAFAFWWRWCLVSCWMQ